MNKIPTAEDLIFKMDKVFFMDSPDTQGTAIDIDSVKELMVEFAKIKVKEALQAAIENATVDNQPDYLGGEWSFVNEDSILNAYPLENIK